MIERVEADGTVLAIILREGTMEPGIHFFTPGDYSQQLGCMRHPTGHVIEPHVHNPVPRAVHFTQEALFLRRGRLRVDFYTETKTYLESRVLGAGDVILLVAGGHGFQGTRGDRDGRGQAGTLRGRRRQDPLFRHLRGRSAARGPSHQRDKESVVIPVSEPLLDHRVLANVEEAVRSGWISSEGRFIADFERRWANYCGVSHGIAVCNGTVALEVAMAALDLPPGSEVILPSFTIISCVAAVLRTGCRPVLVDCEPDTWCLDVGEVERKITERTRAIMPVHIYGHMADMDPLMALADKSGLAVVEDAAEAHGAEYRGRRAGGIGAIGCFSFYANKIVTTGEGGMVVTDDAKLAERARSLRNLCFKREQRFLHTELGYNFRMTNVQAAIGLAQIERIDDHLARKRRMAALYGERLRKIGGLRLPAERPDVKNVYWMYGVVLEDSVPFDAAEFAARLKAQGVDTRPFFLGMHEQPVLREAGLFAGESYPVTERLARRGLYLPSGLRLLEAEIDKVCAAVKLCLD